MARGTTRTSIGVRGIPRSRARRFAVLGGIDPERAPAADQSVRNGQDGSVGAGRHNKVTVGRGSPDPAKYPTAGLPSQHASAGFPR
jgi:hypothetical protein